MSKRFFFRIINIFYVLIFLNPNLYACSAITYKPAGGRLGDQLLNYYKAFWLAYRYLGKDKNGKVPLLYVSFIYSDKLMMHQRQMRYTPENVRQYKKIVKLKDFMITNLINKNDRILYESHYYLKIPGWDHYSLDWMNDPVFIQELRQMVAP